MEFSSSSVYPLRFLLRPLTPGSTDCGTDLSQQAKEHLESGLGCHKQRFLSQIFRNSVGIDDPSGQANIAYQVELNVSSSASEPSDSTNCKGEFLLDGLPQCPLHPINIVTAYTEIERIASFRIFMEETVAAKI